MKHDMVLEVDNDHVIVRVKFKHGHCVDDTLLEEISSTDKVVVGLEFVSQQPFCDHVGSHSSCANYIGYIKVSFHGGSFTRIQCKASCFDFQVIYKDVPNGKAFG